MLRLPASLLANKIKRSVSPKCHHPLNCRPKILIPSNKDYLPLIRSFRQVFITCLDIFYFLWGDALFADTEELKNLPSNLSTIEFRRQIVLESLNDEFAGYDRIFGEFSKANALHSEQMQKAKNLYDKILAIALKSLWQMIQLRRHVQLETVEQIKNDCRQNDGNPNFSFEQAIGESLDSSSLPLDVWADIIYDPNDG